MTGPLFRDGLLPVDKPSGPTSHDIVAIVRRTFGTRSVGHTGTLDPFASGLLLLCLGRATRLAEYLGDWPKEYSARARLGVRTATDDLQGEILTESEEWRTITRAEIEEKLSTFVGESLQRPPDYSAKKVGGQAAYALARRGEGIDLPPARIMVHAIEVGAVQLPWVDFRVTCSTGTYVRALARDLGELLGVGAHLTGLRRTAIGPFSVEDAVTLEDLSRADVVEERWISPLRAVSHLPRFEVTEEEAEELRQGRPLRLGEDHPGVTRRRLEADGVGDDHPEVAVSRGGELVAMARLDGDLIRPRKVFI